MSAPLSNERPCYRERIGTNQPSVHPVNHRSNPPIARAVNSTLPIELEGFRASSPLSQLDH